MATVWDHLSVEVLEERFVGCEDATASRHFQVICGGKRYLIAAHAALKQPV